VSPGRSYFDRRADYEVVKITDDVIWIADLNLGSISVTNDAENVVADIQRRHADKRIIYRDSDGNWDELKHKGGQFTGFAPARDMVPT